MSPPSTCCGKNAGGEGCVCASEAKCSCGKQDALNCTCEKAATENTTSGARCSCPRAAGDCTCSRKQVENAKVAGNTCSCGARPADACTCEKSKDAGTTCACGAKPAGACDCKSADGPHLETEIDFTTKK